MELNRYISSGILHLILTTCVACGSNVDDSNVDDTGIFLNVVQFLTNNLAEVTNQVPSTYNMQLCICYAHKIFRTCKVRGSSQHPVYDCM